MALSENGNDIEELARPGQGVWARPRAVRPARAEAEAAVATLIRWAGDDPDRPGLVETPARVVRAYEEWFGGYKEDPEVLLNRTFDEVDSYDGPVELRGIPFHAFCEHHLAPIRGVAHVAYVPRNRVVGISKLARVVDVFARRMQIQERMTSQIARAIDSVLQPEGVAVVIDAEHGCMTSRGVKTQSARMVTRKLLGRYRQDPLLAGDFLRSLQS